MGMINKLTSDCGVFELFMPQKMLHPAGPEIEALRRLVVKFRRHMSISAPLNRLQVVPGHS